MAMAQQDQISRPNPFHRFICDTCGNPLGKHFVFRHEKMADVILGPNGRKPDGKSYCHRDGVGYAGSYHQRELRRTMEPGYA